MKKQNTAMALIIMIVISIFLFSPLLITIINSLFRDLSSGLPKGFTFDFYLSIFGGQESMIPAVMRSIMISIIPTFLMLFFLLLAFYVIQVYYPAWDKYVDLLSKIPYGIQGVILAVSIISLYGATTGFLADRVFLLGAAYCVVILPYMYQGIKNALTTIDMMPILEAAEILGSSKVRAYFTIIVPSILKGIIATILLSIGILFGDFVLVNIIAGSYFQTTSIFLNEVRAQSGHAASAISVVIFSTMLLLTYIANRMHTSESKLTTEVIVADLQEKEREV